MSCFNIVAQSSESTVVTEYKPQAKRSEAYQSEADLENEFIRLLCELGYEYLTIHKGADLIGNLRKQLEKLNDYRFSDEEWKRFWNEVLENTNSGIVEKTRLIQEDYVQVLRRDNGESKNILHPYPSDRSLPSTNCPAYPRRTKTGKNGNRAVMTYIVCCELKSPRDNCCQNIKEYSVLVLDDDIFFSSHKIKNLYSR